MDGGKEWSLVDSVHVRLSPFCFTSYELWRNLKKLCIEQRALAVCLLRINLAFFVSENAT